MKKFAFFFILLTIHISFSQEYTHPIDKENSKCLENAVPTTIGSIKCEQAALASWKTELSKVLKQLKANPKLSNFDLLEASQKKWLAFHKANLKFYYAYYQKQYQGGSMARAAVVTYEKRHLRERVLYLLDLLEELQ
ncbi:lysozyme inhibitor LprI family protein [Kordia sp.]|uniref:lysozyme inhibitor LprI family protein n=1 Tax=Kordia sp. TaxID=1965332 RepID=UPI003D6A3BBA